MTVVLVGSALPAAADEAYGDQPSAESYLSDDGMRAFVGEPSESLGEVADRLQLLADDHPDIIAGVAFSSFYSAVEVYAAELDAPVITEARAIAEASGEQVLFVENRYSLDALLAAQDMATSLDLGEVSLSTISPDFLADRLVVGVDPAAGPAPMSTDAGLAADMSERLGVDVQVVVMPLVEGASDRHSDSAPFTMAGAISSRGGCTLGVPIRIGGVRYALTGGHCLGTEFTTPGGHHVGTTHTTTWPGNARLYGDWKLLRGDFQMSIFHGSLTATVQSQINGGQFGTRPLGRELCSSGRSGQYCRYVVTQTNGITWISDPGGAVPSSHSTVMRHDPDRTGASSCTGWVSGDSGGPVFSTSSVPGSMDMWGIVTATGGRDTGTCSYHATQLSGVRAWNATATVS